MPKFRIMKDGFDLYYVSVGWGYVDTRWYDEDGMNKFTTLKKAEERVEFLRKKYQTPEVVKTYEC